MSPRRIALIYSPTEWPRANSYGLSLLMAVLRADGHEVEYLDGYFHPPRRLLERLRQGRFDVIGISAIITNFDYVQGLAQRAREASPRSTIVCGGGLATAVPEDLLALVPALDACVVDEAEHSLPAFVAQLDGDWSTVPGLVWREDGQLRRNPPAPLILDLDRLPLPAVESVELPRYFYTPGSRTLPSQGRHVNRRAQVLTSRGCPNRCDFCRHSGLGKVYRRRSVDRVLAEIDELVLRWDVNNIEFLDDTFVVEPEPVEPLMRGLVDRGYDLTWGAAGRADRVYPDLLEWMARAGCIGICFGFDSFSQPTLDRMGKGTTVTDNLRAFRACVSAGIVPISNILLGYDNETELELDEDIERIRELIAWGRSLRSERARRTAQVGIRSFRPVFFATPYPGTSLHERNRHRLPPVEALLRRFSGRDMDVLVANVSQVPDAVLRSRRRELVELITAG